MTRALVLCALLVDVALVGCAPLACVTVAQLEAAPPVQATGAQGLLVRMGRELLLAAARARCAE